MALILNGTGALSGIADLAIDTNTLYVDSTNDRVGIGTTSPTVKLDINGDSVLTGTSGYRSLSLNGPITGGTTARYAGIQKNYDSPWEFKLYAGYGASGNGSATIFYRDAVNESLRIDTNGYLINNVNSTKSTTVTAKMVAAASSTATYTIDTTTLGIDSNLYYMCEVTAGAYGNSNSGTGFYKGVQYGFSGGSVYQSITNITNTITGGTWTLSGGTNSVTLSLQNTNASQSKFAIMRFEFTWGA